MTSGEKALRELTHDQLMARMGAEVSAGREATGAIREVKRRWREFEFYCMDLSRFEDFFRRRGASKGSAS